MGRSGATLQCTRIALLRAGLTGADDYEEEEAEEDRADGVLGLFPGAGGHVAALVNVAVVLVATEAHLCGGRLA